MHEGVEEATMKMTGFSSNAHLHSEIRSVQSQLKAAIQNHQTILFKLKDRPVSIKLRVQMCNVQRNIVSLGEKQKKLLTQLRQELEANGITVDQKPSPKTLLKFMPNPMNHVVSPNLVNIKKEPGIKTENVEPAEVITVKPDVVPHPSRRKSKLVPTRDCSNGPINGRMVSSSSLLSQKENSPCSTPSTSQKENSPSSTPSTSPSHNANTNKPVTAKHDGIVPSSASDESQDACIHLPVDPELRRKLQFMTALSLVTREVLAELQNRRTERKRRSTTNPQFLYGNASDVKRKKTAYLSNSAPDFIPLRNTPSNSNKSIKSPAALECISCSSSEGSLSHCSSCSKVFHWNCLFGASTTLSGQELKCMTCQQETSPNTPSNEID